ncbi:MAG: hypothetical protein GXY36_12405 [Chloroflexi bacterium]|nr:hypothetical protein [Chloroflexota bacterium]
MRETQAIIERVRRLSADLQQLELSIDPALSQLQPGQSVFAWVLENNTCSAYLREQWIPIAVQASTLVVELRPQQVYAPGQVVSLLAPVGRPVPLRAGLSRLLLIAEDEAPTPFLLLARRAVTAGIAVTLVLGGSATRYPLEQFPAEVEILRSDTEWKWPDQVETLNWADQVLVLAPPQAQNETYGSLYSTIGQLRHHDIPEGFVSGLYYQRLACGTGACQSCQVPGRGSDFLTCTHGPALDLKDIVFR